MRWIPVFGVAVAITVILIASIFFRVDERQQAVVLRFGEVRESITEPGLHWKWPFVDNVAYYEDRILPLETSALEVTPADERRLVVDAFARWRIADAVQFRRSVQTVPNALSRLEGILNAELRQVLGQVQSSDVLSPERTVLMGRIRDAARGKARSLGVEVIDVRIRRADLPEQNLQATFERMNAEREREAADERARGRERAQEVRATADREAVELVSDAERQSQVIRGEADAERNAIFAGAFGKDEEFFAFYRSLAAYENSLRGDNSTMVISPDSEFFDYLKTDRGDFSPSARRRGIDEGDGSETGGEDSANGANGGDGAEEAAPDDAESGGAGDESQSEDAAAADTAEETAAETSEETAEEPAEETTN